MKKIAAVDKGVDIGKEFASPWGVDKQLGDLVSVVISGALIIAGVIVLFLFIFGGLGMIAGAGQDNPQKAAQGKQAATSAVIGFVIVFGAYWVIRLIEVITGQNFITVPGL